MALDSQSLSKAVYSLTFSSFCQEVSRFRLSHMIKSTNVSIEKISKNQDTEPDGEWMVVVFAHSSHFRLTVKIKYNDIDAQAFAQQCLSSDDPNLSITAINDFMREYGNQLIGGVKQSFQTQSAYVKTSIPLVTLSQDAAFFTPNPTSASFEDQWLLQTKDHQIKCAIALEFLEKNFMKDILLPAFFDKEAIGDVEFL